MGRNRSNATAAAVKGNLVAGTGVDTSGLLAVGANATVLTADSTAATGMKWAAAGGGGKILQVVEGRSTTSTATTSTSYVDTTLTATITPSAASSKILVFVSQDANQEGPNILNVFALFQILRNSTSLMIDDDAGRTWSTVPTTYSAKKRVSMSILDSPATTSATTYKTQMSTNTSSVTITAQKDYLSTIILMEVGA